MNINEIIKKYIEYFNKLLKENNLNRQLEIAKEISEFSLQINSKIEKEYSNEPIQEIQNFCLSMEHWNDETGYCTLKKKDIKQFIKQLNDFIF